jgi:hypothetical protein
MIIVAILALALLAARTYWLATRRLDDPNPLMNSKLSARIPWDHELVIEQPIPITIDYAFRLNVSTSPPGSVFLAWAEVWLEDAGTGLPVVTHIFDAPLTVGARESASGTFRWEPTLDRAGEYRLGTRLRYRRPTGRWQSVSGSKHSGIVVRESPSESGAEP